MEKGMKGAELKIQGDPTTRSGVYANFTMARTTGRETVLDFVFLDSPNGGTVQSRVIMSNQAFVEFAHMIHEHFQNNFEKVE